MLFRTWNHLFLGGNDALSHMQTLKESVQNVGEGFLVLSKSKEEFEKVS
jgi:hypothetical protein